MKTAVVSFKKRTANENLSYEEDFVKFLNGYTIYTDRIVILSKNDDNGLIEALSLKYDLIFLLNEESSGFYLPSVIGKIGLTPDKDGFCGEQTIVSIVPKNYTDDYPEKLEKTIYDRFGISFGKIIFKLYGVACKKVSEVCAEISNSNPDVFFNIAERNGDIKVSLLYSDTASKKQVDKGVRDFIKNLKNHIYAEDDITLEKRLYDVVKLRKQKICTAESMTGGRIASRIVSVDGASDIFYEGLVTYDTLAKERRLNVKHSTVLHNTVVSEAVAYEMASGLLSQKNCSLAITVTGYAGSTAHPDSDDGLCYIGIGVADRIQVFKYRFTGTRTENIENASSAAIFLAIKIVENLDSL